MIHTGGRTHAYDQSRSGRPTPDGLAGGPESATLDAMGSREPAATDGQVSVLLVHGNGALRHTLQMRLQLEPDIRVVGDTAAPAEALELAAAEQPALVVVGAALLLEDGGGLVARIAASAPASRVVALIGDDDGTIKRLAEAAGAAAVVSTLESPDRLLEALRGGVRQR